ncbi:GlxA family transcriptional regulator [Rhodovibrionaceae bacterium A322]
MDKNEFTSTAPLSEEGGACAAAPRRIDLLLFDGVNILDVAGPLQAFTNATRKNRDAYDIRFVSLDGQPVTSCSGLRLLPEGRATLDSPSDTLLVPGGKGVNALRENLSSSQLISSWLEGREEGRVISICSGALLLAEAGLLNGRKATTHWSRQEEAVLRYPEVDWQIEQLYVLDDQVCTSAGVTSGIDLALALIKQECGAQEALAVARELVVYLHRSGGQAQFTNLLELQFAAKGSLSQLLDKLVQQPGLPWDLERMADFSGMTPRTLSRRFVRELGQSPVRFLEQIRVKQAGEAISAGMPAAEVIDFCGFGEFQRMQRAFKRHLGTTVGDYEKRFALPSQALR